ncbi:MAG: hypothetical protein ACXQTS_01975 [Candidatus Methanospirareceae archaeon]
MSYEKFKEEIERILREKGRPVTWKEIKEASGRLKQKAPYHTYVRKLQGDIGLVRFKLRGAGKTVWGLREWFEEGKFKTFLPEQLKLVILTSYNDYAIGIDEYRTLKRIYPLKEPIRRWNVIEVRIEEFFPKEDKRPESVRIKGEIEEIRKIENEEERIKTMERVAESGEFLHTDAWKGKTLGVTKPRFRNFYFYDSRCQFFCDQSACVGHDMEVKEEDVKIYDKVYFLLEAERKRHIWREEMWSIRAVISLSDPKQRRLVKDILP